MAGLYLAKVVARKGMALRTTTTTTEVVRTAVVMSRRQYHRRHCGLAADNWRIRRDDDPSHRKAVLLHSPWQGRTHRSWPHSSRNQCCRGRAFSSSTLAAPDDEKQDGSGMDSTTNSSMHRQTSSTDTSALFNVSKEDEHREETKRRRLSEVRALCSSLPPFFQGSTSHCSRSPARVVFPSL